MSIYLSRLVLKHFRCFAQYEVTFEKPITLIEGANGRGKTSLLEALYYTCYLRSFRASSPKDLIQAGQEGFFVQVQVHDHDNTHAIQIGFARNRRLIKIDEKPIASYKELVHNYRVVSVTEDDLELVKEGPAARRAFIDQATVLLHPEFATTLREYVHLLDQRNAALNRYARTDLKTYEILTQQLWAKAHEIVVMRTQILEQLFAEVTAMITQYIRNEIQLRIHYHPKRRLGETFAEFWTDHEALYEQERRFERTLFGPHVDDIQVFMGDAHARHFASRGQQKLIVVLFKVAVMRVLSKSGFHGVLLLDDFMTDFDTGRANVLLDILHDLPCQLIVTSPVEGGALTDRLATGQRIALTI